jgi:hypothetical protein
VRKIIAVITLICFIVAIPLSSYASVVQEAEMILKAAGKAKVGQYAATLGTGYKAGRMIIGLAGTGAGVIMLGLTVYDLWNKYGDSVLAKFDMGSNYAATPVTPSGNLPAFGSITGLVCAEYLTTEWNTIGGCTSKHSPGVHYNYTHPSCEYSNGNYKEVGMKETVSGTNSLLVYDDCEDTSGTMESAQLFQISHYFAPVSNFNATGQYQGIVGDPLPDYAVVNASAALQLVADAAAMVADRLQNLETQLGGMTNPSGQPLDYNQDMLQAIVDALALKSYVDVGQPDDYELAHPEAPPSPIDEPQPKTGTNPDDSEQHDEDVKQGFLQALEEFFGTAPSVPQQGELDTNIDSPEEHSIKDLITGFLSQSPLIAVITGSGVQASSGQCSVEANVFNKPFKIDFCHWQSTLNMFGQLYLTFMSFYAVLYIFRKD